MTALAALEIGIVGHQFELDVRADAVDFIECAFHVAAICA